MAVVLLAALGVALVAVGVVVLIRYPDRPGGVLRFRDVEVGSKGAGLPLVVVGVVLAVVAVTTVPPAADTGGGADSVTSSAAAPEVPGLDVVPGNDCTTAFFAQEPPVDATRVRSAELDAVDRQVVGPGEAQDTEFGLVFSDTASSAEPVVLGAMKLSRAPGRGFHVSGLVDATTCRPAGLSLADNPGVPAPAALGDYVWVALRLGGSPYVLLLNSSNAGTEVLVTLRRRP